MADTPILVTAPIDATDPNPPAADALGRALGDEFIARGAARFQNV